MNNSVSVDAQLCFDGYTTVFWWMHDSLLVDARLCLWTTLFMHNCVSVYARESNHSCDVRHKRLWDRPTAARESRVARNRFKTLAVSVRVTQPTRIVWTEKPISSHVSQEKKCGRVAMTHTDTDRQNTHTHTHTHTHLMLSRSLTHTLHTHTHSHTHTHMLSLCVSVCLSLSLSLTHTHTHTTHTYTDKHTHTPHTMTHPHTHTHTHAQRMLYINQGFKVLLSFWPLGARKRSYIRTRHSLWTSTCVLLINNYHTIYIKNK